MTKKEKEAFQQLKEQVALSWPRYPKPERVSIHADYRGLMRGWFQHNYADNYRVTEGCSNGVHHSRTNTHKTDSQSGGVFYRSEVEALRAARWEMTERFAKALQRIDADIETAEAKEVPDAQ